MSATTNCYFFAISSPSTVRLKRFKWVAARFASCFYNSASFQRSNWISESISINFYVLKNFHFPLVNNSTLIKCHKNLCSSRLTRKLMAFFFCLILSFTFIWAQHDDAKHSGAAQSLWRVEKSHETCMRLPVRVEVSISTNLVIPQNIRTLVDFSSFLLDSTKNGSEEKLFLLPQFI